MKAVTLDDCYTCWTLSATFELCAATSIKTMARIPKRIPARTVIKKVRFSLPADSSSDDDIDDDVEEEILPTESDHAKPNEPANGEPKVHGTAKYINGTLNFCRNDAKASPTAPKAPPKKEKKEKKAKKESASVTTFPRSSLANNNNGPIESPVCSDYWTKAFNGCKVIYHAPSARNPAQKKNRRRTKIRACTTILLSPTNYIRRSACFRNMNKKKFKRLPNELQVPPLHAPGRRRAKFSCRKQFIRLFSRSKVGCKGPKLSTQVSRQMANKHYARIDLLVSRFRQEINERISLMHLCDPIHQPTTIDPMSTTKVVLNDFEQRWSQFHNNRLKYSNSSCSSGCGNCDGGHSTFTNASTIANHLVDYRAFEKSDANKWVRRRTRKCLFFFYLESFLSFGNWWWFALCTYEPYL